MRTPTDLALRNWRSGLYTVHFDHLSRFLERDDLTGEERRTIERQLAAASAHGVLMDERLSWHLVQAGDETYLVAALDMDWACFYAWEETGERCVEAVPERGRTLVLKVLARDRTLARLAA